MVTKIAFGTGGFDREDVSGSIDARPRTRVGTPDQLQETLAAVDVTRSQKQFDAIANAK